MKRDLKLLFTGVEHKMRHPRPLSANAEHWSMGAVRHRVGLSARSLTRLWEVLTGKRHLSAEAKNRLALLAGFQSWDDFKGALKGDVDAQINYEEKKKL